MPEKKEEFILVSACLLGQKVRYDGSEKYCSSLSSYFSENPQLSVVAVCPEMLSGLPCPRCPAEIDPTSGRVFAANGTDVTIFFELGAQLTLNICENYGIKRALLKSKSPSCGSGQIYDGSFKGRLRKGKGKTAELLSRNGICVLSEERAEQTNKN